MIRSKTTLLAAGLLAAMTMTGCGGGSSRETADTPPDWYTDPPDRGPRVMVGVGEGANRRAAYNNAAAELSRQLQLSINVDDSTVREYTSLTAGSSDTGRSRSERLVEEARQTVQASSGQDDLPGVNEEAYHQGTRRDYVMVTFDRQRWASDLVTRLGEMDEQLAAAAQRLDELGQGPEAIALARDLLPMLAEREHTAERINVADPSYQIPAPPVTMLEIQERLRALVDELRLFVQLDADHAAMRPALVESLAASGLPVVASRDEAQFDLGITVRTTIRTFDGVVRADGAADLILTQHAGNRQLAATSIQDRASAADPAIATERVLDRLAAALAEHIDEHIVDWLAR